MLCEWYNIYVKLDGLVTCFRRRRQEPDQQSKGRVHHPATYVELQNSASLINTN
jgi:hypothetical protein